MFNGREYNPTELRDLCTVDRFYSDYQGPNYIALEIMGIVLAQRDPNKLVKELKDVIERIGKVSIGQSLQTLRRIGEETDLQGGLDGIDALCYHLNIDTVKRAISVLQRVEKRFSEESQNEIQNG